MHIFYHWQLLYLKILKQGLAELPKADQTIRQEINELAREKGWESVYQELKSIDPDSARRIKPTDSQRLQRAIEVYRLAGATMTQLQKIEPSPCTFPLKEVGILPFDRTKLHESISRRFHLMLERGFVGEVVDLKSNSCNHIELPAMRAVGYRQIWSYLDGDIDYQNLVRTSIFATRQLAKRQYTWLRNWENMIFMDKPELTEVLKII